MPSISGLTANPTVFDPGRGQTSTISFTASGASRGLTISVQVFSGASVVRTVPNVPQMAGAVSVPWDGKDDSGAVEPAGTYTVTVTVADTTGSTQQSTSVSI